MTKPTMEEYVTKARGDYYSGITKIMINGKAAYELKGKFLDDLRNNAFSGTNGEDVVEHIENFLKIVDPLNLPNKKGDDQEILSDLEEAYAVDEDEIAEIFKIKSDVFDYETPLGKAFDEFNYLFKIDTYLLTNDIPGFKTYDEFKNEWMDEWNKGIPLGSQGTMNGKAKWPTCSSNEDGICNGGELPRMFRVGYMTYFQDYKWYDDLMDGNLKEEALKQKDMNERSWGDATQGVMNFCAWLKRCFENFH
ncbi:hypothetical protein Tco_0035761 [Tanacetum coccineum]